MYVSANRAVHSLYDQKRRRKKSKSSGCRSQILQNLVLSLLTSALLIFKKKKKKKAESAYDRYSYLLTRPPRPMPKLSGPTMLSDWFVYRVFGEMRAKSSTPLPHPSAPFANWA
ncbi:hypothetical protein K445DRAFT_183028 [Daldinia sp. EC12]|nr:hypothetical protein K445DRAFT_183028 [Daldinia sp. EC12]